VTARIALRTAVLTATTVLLALPAHVAVAAGDQPTNTYDNGDQPGTGLTVLQTLGLFVGIPVLVILAIVVLVMAPSSARGPRYRPGVGWWAAPVWFNGPDNPERAVREAVASTGHGGGASARW
jgi:hypothetical protein